MLSKKKFILFCSVPCMVFFFLLPWFLVFRAFIPSSPTPVVETTLHEVRFNAVGDIMLSRTVAQKIRNADNPLLPFQKMAPLLLGSDFNFWNLETPVTDSHDIGAPDVLVFNTPSSYAAGLKEYGFDILNLANNHAFDQEEAGLFSTLEYLQKEGIASVGAGRNLDEAWQPAVIEKNGIRICFIGASYSSLNDNGTTRNDFIARTDDLARMKASVSQSKKLCDFTVMSMHAGIEYTRDPTSSQRDFAHAAIDAGVDFVIGAHPHWTQTIERYCPQIEPSCAQPKYIFYSLGNFIFDQEFSQDTKEWLMLEITLQVEKIGKATLRKDPGFKLIPIVIENYSTPRPATDIEATRILGKIGETKAVLGRSR